MRRTLRARICLSVLLALPAAGLGSRHRRGAPRNHIRASLPSAMQYQLRSTLERALGDRTAGSYLDADDGRTGRHRHR